jgi:hypothetical protein
VTRSEVEDAFAQNASFFASMSPHEARERLRLDLENQTRMRRYRAGVEELRKKWPVVLKLPPPPNPGTELDDGSPVKGAVKAAVTIVEFSDFECPFCAQVQDTLRQIVDRYGGAVRLIFKHLPSEGHRHSLLAARAAYCAAGRIGSGSFTMRCLRRVTYHRSRLARLRQSLGLAGRSLPRA